MVRQGVSACSVAIATLKHATSNRLFVIRADKGEFSARFAITHAHACAQVLNAEEEDRVADAGFAGNVALTGMGHACFGV
jgi:hypothetical protein